MADLEIIPMESVEFIVEQTDFMEEKLSQIKMTMALALAAKLGKTEIDMNLKKDTCERCPIHSVPHYHFIGTENA